MGLLSGERCSGDARWHLAAWTWRSGLLGALCAEFPLGTYPRSPKDGMGCGQQRRVSLQLVAALGFVPAFGKGPGRQRLEQGGGRRMP